MPNLDGIGLIRQRARRIPRCKGLPIIMLTTESQEVAQAGGQGGRRHGLDREAVRHPAAAGGGEEGARMIDKYKQAFQEEARELLAELESALLELDQKRDDREVVGRAFRALHTIKGSGAMFGFDDVAGFAHNLETAFDRLRNGQLAATAEPDQSHPGRRRSDQDHAGRGCRPRHRRPRPVRGHSRGTAPADRLDGAGAGAAAVPRRCAGAPPAARFSTGASTSGRVRTFC